MFFQRLKTPGLGHNSYVARLRRGPRRRRRSAPRRRRVPAAGARERSVASPTCSRPIGRRISSSARATLAEADRREDRQRHPRAVRRDRREAEGRARSCKVGTTRFVALETPGHTPESVTYAVYVKDAGEKCWGAFTGDALFVGDTGRTDLPDPREDRRERRHPLRLGAPQDRAAGRSDAALSGARLGVGVRRQHLRPRRFTLGIEKGTNPVFKKSRTEFVAAQARGEDGAPAVFHAHGESQSAGRPAAWRTPARHVLQPKDFQKRMKEGVGDRHALARGVRRRAHPGARTTSGSTACRRSADGSPTRRRASSSSSTSPEEIEQAVKSLARIGIDTVRRRLLTSGVETLARAGPADRDARDHERARRPPNGCSRDASTCSTCATNTSGTRSTSPARVHQLRRLSRRKPARSCPKDSEIVVHCSVGHRSGVAVQHPQAPRLYPVSTTCWAASRRGKARPAAREAVAARRRRLSA